MLETKLWRGERQEDLEEAAECLLRGELVAFPTETVYGLGADAFNKEASLNIYLAKGRPSDNPLIVHIYDRAQLKQLVVDVPPLAEKAMAVFWPGPLTLVLKKGDSVPSCITGGLSSVAVRMPNHPVALALLKLVNKPIAAPSANQSGKPSPTLACHVWHDLQGKIAGIVDGGPTTVGLESTVLDFTNQVPTILRPGGISSEQLERVLGKVAISTGGDSEAPRAPGMKYTHYAPDAPVQICQGNTEAVVAKIRAGLASASEAVGLLISKETLQALGDIPPKVKVQILGSQNDLAEVASNLFAGLRWLDEQKIDIIYTEAFGREDIGSALMNRLEKAAGVGNQ